MLNIKYIKLLAVVFCSCSSHFLSIEEGLYCLISSFVFHPFILFFPTPSWRMAVSQADQRLPPAHGLLAEQTAIYKYLCVCVWWTGQQHEGHTWTTLPGPERLYLRQGGIPHSSTVRLLHRCQSYLHIPSGSQLPLWRLQDWQQRVYTPGQDGWSQVHQTSQKSLPISRPGQLHDPLLIP